MTVDVTIATADMDKPETLKDVLQDAYGVFLITAFWPREADGGNGANEPLNPVTEKNAAMNVINIATMLKRF